MLSFMDVIKGNLEKRIKRKCKTRIFVIVCVLISTGPKPKTIADFWTLISQEEVTVIVCLTNLKEGAKVFIPLK